ncbi:MAG: hypothetical protein ACJ73S_19535 [Mycobacteriales bacterium]
MLVVAAIARAGERHPSALRRRAGWRYRNLDAELTARVRRLFPEFG